MEIREILGLVFAAGGAWFLLKETQRHVNGLGAKVNSIERERHERQYQVAVALALLASTEEQKKIVAQCLLGETK
jgi:hypothetical protein